VLDALHDIAYFDDAVVDEVRLSKTWGAPGVFVEVYY
jgi:hypothetical protein